MTTSTSVLEFFTLMDHQGGAVVRETPRLDLDVYIQSYRGRTRFDRLLLIGRSSVSLCVDALKAALAEAKKGRDVGQYREAWELLRVAAPDDPDATPDQTWLTNTERSNKAETQRLETELRGYKNNLIRESIRMGHEDLARHLEHIGELGGAADYYVKMRPDLNTPKHFLDIGKRIVNIMVHRRDWQMALVHVNKVMTNGVTEEERLTMSYVRVVQAVAYLGMEQYREAASHLLMVDSQAASGNTFNDVASANDVAVMGGLLALATMERRELQAGVLENANFRTFLELEPLLRKAISLFVNGRYKNCLALLEAYRTDYLLDIYMQRHVDYLYATIRNKCIMQFFVPYSVVTLSLMNETFAQPGESVEEELAVMIRNGALNARINSIDGLIEAVSTDRKAATRRATLDSARLYQRETVDWLRHMNLVGAELELRGHGQRGGGVARGAAANSAAAAAASLLGIEAQWFDDPRRPLAPTSTAAVGQGKGQEA